jgi:hypothetical protein
MEVTVVVCREREFASMALRYFRNFEWFIGNKKLFGWFIGKNLIVFDLSHGQRHCWDRRSQTN